MVMDAEELLLRCWRVVRKKEDGEQSLDTLKPDRRGRS